MPVLLYVMDALRPDVLPCYGSSMETAPNLSKLSERAVVYENAYSTATWTKAAAASIFTGHHPRSLNVMHQMDRLPAQATTWPLKLQDAGYNGYAFSGNNFVSEEFGFTGFDQFSLLQRDHKLRDRRRAKNPSEREKEKMAELGIDELVTVLSDDINDRLFPIVESGEENWFACAWSIDTHGPYFVRGDRSYFGNDPDEFIFESEVDEKNLEKTKSLYHDMVRYNDVHFGRLVRKLKNEDVFDDTLLIVAGDHGEAFGEHSSVLGKPIVGHESVVFEEAIKVPLLIKFPKDRHAGKRIQSPVQLTDIHPTILQECNLPIEPEIEGRSIDPSDGLLDPGRTIFVESQPTPNHIYSAAVLSNNQKLITIKDVFPSKFIIGRLAKAVLWKLQIPSVQLYDLGEDPGEHHNLAPEREQAVRELMMVYEDETERMDALAARVSDDTIDELKKETEDQLKAMGYLE